MKFTNKAFILLAILLPGCSGTGAQQETSAGLSSDGFSKITIADIFNSIYDGKELSDPGSAAWKIPGSIGLPQVQNIEGAINNGKLDSTILVNFLQHEADVFSWQSLISITWPLNGEGKADSSTYKTVPGTSIWESWMPSHQIFKEDGSSPDPWPYSGVRSIDDLRALGKLNVPIENMNNLDGLNAEHSPIIDKNGNYVMYEVFFNKTAYDYVVRAGLYNKAGQQAFVKNWPNVTSGLIVSKKNENGTIDTVNIQKEYLKAYFPIGNIKDSTEVKKIGGVETTFQFNTGEGAIIVKTAWSQLLPGEDKSIYFTREVSENGSLSTYGLVGMHIAHKVAEATQWVWSSFEHSKNYPSMVDGDVSLTTNKYRFFNPSNTKFESYNKPPRVKYDPIKSKRVPTQVVKLIQPMASAQKVNAFFHDLVRRSDENSIWLNYQLVGTQWPLMTKLFTAGGSYQPQLLGNAILETYQQGKSSCMGCHRHARFLYDDSTMTGGYSADFIYSLNSVK